MQTAPAQAALLNLHGALEFLDLWKALQDLFEAIVPHDSLIMSVNYVDWRSEFPTKRLWSNHSRIFHEADDWRYVAQDGMAIFQLFLDTHHGIRAYKHSEVVPEPRRIVASPYYRKYMIRYGWRYSAHLLLWKDEEINTAFGLRRRADQGDFTPAEMDALSSIHPHVKVAFDHICRHEEERQRRQLLEGFYRAKPDAVLLLDWNMEPTYASQDALALCAAWNLGRKQARNYTPRAVFVVPQEVKILGASPEAFDQDHCHALLHSHFRLGQ